MSAAQAAPLAIDFRRVEHATLLMHFDDVWATRILDGDLLGLSAAEKALFATIDRRAFHADPDRAARACRALVEELPVAVAVAGLPRLLSFFRDDAFVDVITGGIPLVVGAARFLDNVPARIEGAIAAARRRRRVPAAAVALAPHVAAAVVPVDALARWSDARAALGGDMIAAVAGGTRVDWPTVDDADGAGVVVTEASTNPAVGGAALALACLLTRLEQGATVSAFRTIACAEGCDDDDEADALLDDLVADGLLCRG